MGDIDRQADWIASMLSIPSSTFLLSIEKNLWRPMDLVVSSRLAVVGEERLCAHGLPDESGLPHMMLLVTDGSAVKVAEEPRDLSETALVLY